MPAVQGFVQRQGRVSGRELSKFPWTSYKRESPSGCPGSRGRGVRVWAAHRLGRQLALVGRGAFDLI